ncbi:hypothetical protein FOCC_FOCC011054 [Frankliniella occidentalis]|uniref:Uncharacterized protein LOC113214875 n=1 Tax=Frankliniella occidentalis TaxID=133901 RepID=A0A6J1TH29_FRAOC|nr:uncharacterized protein LOC113214875 [Frankliniella occidentalis]KAE8743355.1 hypothetical protein FOCC_FOCC011054 [Frankliniella occidentalis]
MKSLLCVVLALGCIALAQATAVSERETFGLVEQDSKFMKCAARLGTDIVAGLQAVAGFFTITLAIPVFGLIIAPLITLYGLVTMPVMLYQDMVACFGEPI